AVVAAAGFAADDRGEALGRALHDGGLAPRAVRRALVDHDGAGAVVVAEQGGGGDGAADGDGRAEGVAANECLWLEPADGRDAVLGIVAVEAVDGAAEAAVTRRADPDLAAVGCARGAEAVLASAVERGEAAELAPLAGRLARREGEDDAARGVEP